MRIIASLVCLFIISLSYAQDESKEENIDYYFTYKDYSNRTPNLPEKAKLLITEESSGYLLYQNFVSAESGKKIKKGYSIWGISYKGDLYHNLILSNYEISKKVFAKFDIIGKKYNVIILDTKIDRKAIGHAVNPYGGGLIASALYNPSMTTWKDRKGNSYKILFYNVENPEMSSVYKDNAFVQLLNAKILVDLYKNDNEIIEKLKMNEYYLEDFIEFIEKENSI